MKLGTKLILCLVSTLVVIMLVHGYWSIQQDKENIVREMRVGMMGLSRSIQAALRYIYGVERDVKATQNFIDSVGRSGNIHGVVVYDSSANPIAISASLTDTKGYPNLDPAPVLNIDPRPVLANGNGIDGYFETPAHPIYYRVEPILDGENRLVGAFVLGRRGTGYDLTLEARRNRIILTTLILIALLTMFILFLVQRNVSRPIKQLVERVRDIGDGRWNKRIAIEGTNEISSLALEFNQMSERLQDLYGRFVQEQHERLSLERSLSQSDKLAFVRQLFEFSRRMEPAFRNVELSPLVQKVIGLLEHKIAEKNVTVVLKIDRSLPPVPADPDQLQQVFLNLFLNSLQALRSGGRIDISAKIASSEIEDGGERKLRVEFEDNGAGIPAEHLSQVFDPFFTTKDVGEGTGLGLSVSYGIIKDHGGEIRVDSKPGEYTRFTILLPVQNHHGFSETRTTLQ